MCLSLKWWKGSANIKLNKEKTFISTLLTLAELCILRSLQLTNGQEQKGQNYSFNYKDWG